MTKTLKEIMQKFTYDEQAEIQAEADKLISDEIAKKEALSQDLKQHQYPYFVKDWETRIDTQISQETYNELKKVHEKLIEILFIEEKLDILLSNYCELEQTLLDLSLKSSIFNYKGNQDNSFDELNLVDRRIVNLLASCRMYTDQTKHSLSKIYSKKSKEYKTINEFRKNIKDNNFSYKLMEIIRNHNQHCGLVVSEITKSCLSIQKEESHYLEHRIKVITKTQYLDENSRSDKDKDAVLKQLKDLEGEEFNLIKYIRDYIGLIGKIHFEIREILRKDTEEWSKFYIDLIQKYKSHKKETGKTLVSFFRRDANSSEIIEQFDLIQDIIISRCQKLQQKNSKLNLQFTLKNYVSSKID